MFIAAINFFFFTHLEPTPTRLVAEVGAGTLRVVVGVVDTRGDVVCGGDSRHLRDRGNRSLVLGRSVVVASKSSVGVV